MSDQVQNLYEVCKASFSGRMSSGSGGRVPSPSTIKAVRTALDMIECAHVGLDSWEQAAIREEWDCKYSCYHKYRLAPTKSGGYQADRCSGLATRVLPITYLHLHEQENSFSMGVFCFPATAVIPLHDHPDMTVFSKLLYGSMHVRSYDWVDPHNHAKIPGSARLAKLVADEVVTAPCETDVLFPTNGGNIHAFTALTPCAMLDVLTPPYSPIDGRRCTFYTERGVSCGSYRSPEFGQELDLIRPVYVWLEDILPSKEESNVLQGSYNGQKIKL